MYGAITRTERAREGKGGNIILYPLLYCIYLYLSNSSARVPFYFSLSVSVSLSVRRYVRLFACLWCLSASVFLSLPLSLSFSLSFSLPFSFSLSHSLSLSFSLSPLVSFHPFGTNKSVSNKSSVQF